MGCSPQAPGTIPPSRRSPNTLHSIAKPISHCEPRPYRLRSSRSLMSLSAIERESTLILDYTPLRRSHRESWRARDLYSARPTQLQPTRQARHTSILRLGRQLWISRKGRAPSSLSTSSRCRVLWCCQNCSIPSCQHTNTNGDVGHPRRAYMLSKTICMRPFLPT